LASVSVEPPRPGRVDYGCFELRVPSPLLTEVLVTLLCWLGQHKHKYSRARDHRTPFFSPATAYTEAKIDPVIFRPDYFATRVKGFSRSHAHAKLAIFPSSPILPSPANGINHSLPLPAVVSLVLPR
jgi:hypothetical protein